MTRAERKQEYKRRVREYQKHRDELMNKSPKDNLGNVIVHPTAIQALLNCRARIAPAYRRWKCCPVPEPKPKPITFPKPPPLTDEQRACDHVWRFVDKVHFEFRHAAYFSTCTKCRAHKEEIHYNCYPAWSSSETATRITG